MTIDYKQYLNNNPNSTTDDRLKVLQYNLQQKGALPKPQQDTSNYKYMSDDNQYINMRTPSGGYSTVHVDSVDKYQALGYNSNLDAPLDYSKLPSNSVYRPENAAGVNGQHVAPLSFYNVPGQGTGMLGSGYGGLAGQKGQVGGAYYNNSGGGQGNSSVGSIYDAQQAMLMAQFKAHRDKALGQFNEQKAGLQPQYQSMRDQSDVANAQAVNRMREAMAANGLASGDRALGGSGDNITAQTALANQRQGNLNTLNLQQQQATNTIDNNIADLMNPMHEQAITSQIEFERAKAMLQDMYRQQDVQFRNDEFDWRKMIDTANQTGQFNGGQTLAAQNQAFNQNFMLSQDDWKRMYDMANLTGYFGDNRTLDAQNADIRNMQIMAGLTGQMPNGNMTFDAQQQLLENAWKQSEINARLSSGGSSFSSNQDNKFLLDVWKAYGQAPSGLEQYGIQPGTNYYEKPANVKEDPYNQAMAKAMQMAQSDPRLKSDMYGNPPNQELINSVINEYYRKIAVNQGSSNSALSNILSKAFGGLQGLVKTLPKPKPQPTGKVTDNDILKYVNQ